MPADDTGRDQQPHGLTPKQLELRRGVLGGTDATAILGLSRYRTAWDVYTEKIGAVPPSGEMSEDARWGVLLEPVIRAEYRRRTDSPVVKPRRLIRARGRRWQAGHLDGLADDRLLEVKVRSWPGNAWGDEGTDEVPADVKAQVEHYLAVTGLPFADIAVLFRGQRLAIYRINASPLLEDLTAEEQEWWQRHVVQGEQPDWDGSPGASRFLRQRHPQDDGVSLVALPHHSAVLEEFATVRQQREALEAREAALIQQIQSVMGEASELLSPDMKITWRRSKDGKPVVDWESYAHDLEGLVEQVALGALPVGMDPLETRSTLKGLHTGPGRPGSRRFTVKFKSAPQLEGEGSG